MGDISKKTLAVLFIIAVVLSAVATWKMLSTPTTVLVSGDDTAKGDAHISFGVGLEPRPAEYVAKDGQVTFEIE